MRIKKILVIATRQIGDVLVTTPLIHQAKMLWPEAQIDFLGYEGKLGMLDGNPDIHRCIESPHRPKSKDYLRLFKQLWSKYDLALITQPSDRAYMYGWLAAKIRVGVVPNETQLAWWKKRICMHTVEVDYFHQHVVTEKLRLLEPFTNSKEQPIPVHVIPPAQVELPTDITSQLTDEFIVVHPTPLTAYKRWSTTNWVNLIETLSKTHTVVLSGAPADQDIELNNKIVNQLSAQAKSSVMNLTGMLQLNQWGTLLRKAKLYIGVDTSVSHLAAACNTPTIVLFGATPPTNFGPWPNGFIGQQPFKLVGQEIDAGARLQIQNNVCIVQGPGDCVPCRKAGCEDRADSRSECLEKLNVRAVLDACQKYLISTLPLPPDNIKA